ncbi:MAG: glycosyltransferase [Thermodesulfobacteriota bacterium]|nr:glycosyltransferase [Thermodesulfobacteriota bacterium]
MGFLKSYISIQLSGQFDRKWYAMQYPDVAKKGSDLLKHYIRYGAGERRNPSKEFDTGFYLNRNPDVIAKAINPLLHYILYGRKEGRSPNPRDYARIVYHRHTMLACQGKKNNESSFLFDRSAVIIAETSLPQCLKYRVNQTKSIFTALGFQVAVIDWRDFQEALSALQCCSVVIFYRVPLYDGFFARYFSECRRLKIQTGYDIDDPVFDSCTVVANGNIDHLADNVVQSLVNDAPMLQLPLFSCDFSVVSTEGMRRLLQETGYAKPIIVRRNGFDEETLAISDRINAGCHNRTNSPIIIMYATPSKSHQSDFLLIEKVLVQVLTQYEGQVRLLTVGDLALSQDLEQVSRLIDTAEVTDYAGFLQVLSNVDINIVPLVPNDFNATKSNIKFLDAAAVGVPSVCAAVGDYRNLIDGKDCFLADTEAEWLEKLSRLIDDEKLRVQMGQYAGTVAREQFSLPVVAKELAAYLLESE